MSDKTVPVPLSQSLGVGQRDSATKERDTGGTPSGTTSLKALAAKVLKRDTRRDRCGTATPKDCPTRRATVGQSFEPVPAVPADDLEERAAAKVAPLLMSDGRRLWRVRAHAIPTKVSPDDAMRSAIDEARWHGCVLVADGNELVVVERLPSGLPDDARATLLDNAGTTIAVLRGRC